VLHWRVIAPAKLAILLLPRGLFALILPDPQEEPVGHRFDEQHSVRALATLDTPAAYAEQALERMGVEMVLFRP
jgi:hypothetical protein